MDKALLLLSLSPIALGALLYILKQIPGDQYENQLERLIEFLKSLRR